MRNLLVMIFMVLPVASMAAVDADFEGQNLCVDMAEMEMPYAYDVFCKTFMVYDRYQLCEQLECLVNWHVTHCHPRLEVDVTMLGEAYGVKVINGYPALMQGSEALTHIENAQERYCQ